MYHVQAAIDALKLLSSGFGSENDFLGGEEEDGEKEQGGSGNGGDYQGEELPGDDTRGTPIAEEAEGGSANGVVDGTPSVNINGVLHHVTPLIKIDGMSVEVPGMMSNSPTISAQVLSPRP